MKYLFLCFAVSALARADSGVERQLASIARQRDALAGFTNSIALQQASGKKQLKAAPAEGAEFFAIPWVSAKHAMESVRGEEPGNFGCDVIPPFEARNLVEKAARKAGIDPNLLHAVAAQESAFRPCAVSNKGAQGLMQLMPATAIDMGVRDPFDPAESLAGGAALLKQLLNRYSGDLNRVLGAYNAGPARVDAAGGVPAIPETIQYVSKILGSLP